MRGRGWGWIALLWVELVSAAVVLVLLAGGRAGVQVLILSAVWSSLLTIIAIAIIRAFTSGRGGGR